MTDTTELHRALITRVLDGDGKAPTELRRAAFDNAGLNEPIRTLVEKVTVSRVPGLAGDGETNSELGTRASMTGTPTPWTRLVVAVPKLSGSPLKSMRPPQQTMAGHDSLLIPAK